jgi:peptidoglycan/xylan/chitin deacetylase (PgdA/CDA1 family)
MTITKRHIQKILTNPLVLIVPVIAALWLAWGQYVGSNRALSLPTQNILPFGTFDKFNGDKPMGWQLTQAGQMHVATSKIAGYVRGSALQVNIDHYQSGDLELRSSRVDVSPKTTYLYKGYYHSSVDFDVLVDYFYTDGSSSLVRANSYPSKSDPWSTDSVAFTTAKNVKAVQFVYRWAENGTLQLDNTYLEHRTTGVQVSPTPTAGENLIPNGALQTTANDKPVDWSSYQTGKNQASFAYASGTPQKYLKTVVGDYKNGEAKWTYQPLAVQPGQAFQFGVSYQSTAPVTAVAEYVLHDGQRKYSTLDNLLPAGEWTSYTATLEVPADASYMTVLVSLQDNGTLDTRNYSLINITKPGPHEFARPLVSFTFDDGWESAYQNATPALDKAGYKGTFYINPTALDTRNFMSTAQLNDLKNRGEELASHGYTHLDMTAISDPQLTYQMQKANEFMQRITGIKNLDFATPFGKSDAEVQWYAHKYYRSMRSTTNGINTKQNLDPYNLRVLYISESTSDQAVQDALAQTKAQHGWLILVYHRIDESDIKASGETAAVKPAVLAKQVKMIQQSGITVATVAHALDEVTR